MSSLQDHRGAGGGGGAGHTVQRGLFILPMIILFLVLAGLTARASVAAATIEEAYGYSDCSTYSDPHDYDPRPHNAPECSIMVIEEAFKSATWTSRWESEGLGASSYRFARFFCKGVPGREMREFRQRITHRLLAWTPNVTKVLAATCYHTSAAGVAQDDEECRIRCGHRSLVHELQVERKHRTCIYAWEWPEYKTTNEFKYANHDRIMRQCD